MASGPPVAAKLAKQAVLAAEEGGLSAELEQERRLYELTMATEDRVEGMSAFLDKRKPDWEVAMANVFEPEFDAESGATEFRYRRARLGWRAGSEQLGVSLYEIPPGQATFPYHWHAANEEMMLVFSEAAGTDRLGMAQARDRRGRLPVRRRRRSSRSPTAPRNRPASCS